jgi:hypothetical protein
MSPPDLPGRFLLVLGIALLACLIAFSGCTQPVIPSPVPSETTPPPVVTTQVVVPLPATTSQGTQKGQDYLTYENSQYGFSISYPSGWRKQENTGGSVVVFTSPTTGMVSDIPATMSVTVDDLRANPMSLEQYKNSKLAGRQGLPSFNMLQDMASKGSDFTGWKTVCTANPGTLTEWVEVYAIRGMTAYTVTFTSREDRYASFVIQSDAMFKSFQLTG